MNTKPIPIIMALSAALVSCLISISQGVDFATFLARLILSVFLFYFVGIVVGIFLLNAFGPPRVDGDDDIFDNETEQEEELEEPTEDDNSEDGVESEEEPTEEIFEGADTSGIPMEDAQMTGDAGMASIPQENIEEDNIAGSVDL